MQMIDALDRLCKPDSEGWARFPLEMKRQLTLVAPALVRPDQRIVDVADLLMVLGMLLLFSPDYRPDEQQAVDRITALIGGES